MDTDEEVLINLPDYRYAILSGLFLQVKLYYYLRVLRLAHIHYLPTDYQYLLIYKYLKSGYAPPIRFTRVRFSSSF